MVGITCFITVCMSSYVWCEFHRPLVSACNADDCADFVSYHLVENFGKFAPFFETSSVLTHGLGRSLSSAGS